ncbi:MULTISPECIES: AI-2E family transporter [unclassified Clostridium]|uniref:AI-2E family transporter n=1 Tax=Clostridium TaxID=1485 RepID=UPI001C8CBBC5|nr:MULTISPECIES: AI-2E family transporter [unclassified Clostridium]MBX9137472.1 AI-2E family transporter [Clostridium sp. K12(2020)]MBX9144282.1 AI-2E family transporter [Clostridium sp. K13]MDU2291888.1 AI-2E family transporter [Clostridium celatum]MDU4326417.1 AI-2E family transporter [Clostridium celatum]
MKINWNNKYATIAIYAFLVICGSILLYLGISQMSTIKSSISDFMGTLQPFIIGGALAYLLNFILRFYEDYILSHEAFNKLKKSGKRGIGLLLTYITASIITYLFIQFVLPQLMDSIIGLVNNIPEYVNDVTKFTNDIVDNLNLQPEYINLITDKFGEAITYIITILSNLVPVIGNFVVGATSSILNIIIGIIVSIYILIDKEKFMALGKKIVYALCSEEKAKFILRLATQSNMTFSRFIGGKILDSFIIGVLTFIILSIFKMPYILLISVIIGVTNIIPFFGPFIGGIPAAIIILFVSPIQALWFVIIIIVIQQIDGNIIGPKILGDSIGISAFWILFSLLVAAKFMGFVGMVVGVPLFAIFYSIIKEIIENKLSKKGLPVETEKYK